MRVVLIAPFARYPKGTTRGRVLPLARALAERGHQVTVLVPPYDHPEESGARYSVGRAQVETLTLREAVPEHSPRQAVVQPPLALAIVRRALALRPDVVHVFKPKAVSGITQMLLWYGRRWTASRGGRGRRGWPALVLDTDDWEGHGGWNEYEAYPWWQKEACDFQERWGLRHADALTVASHTLEVQAWSHRVPPAGVAYLPNGLEPADYPGWEAGHGRLARERLGIGDGPLLLLYTRFFEFGPERVWEVLRHVRAARPEVRLLVVGSGKFGQEQQLARLAERAGSRDAVIAAGWQAPEALPDLLAAGNVALFPADDNLANRAKCSVKVLEALWLRRPVVADAVGQLAEYVRQGETGLLADPAAPETMAAAALRLLAEPELARRLAETGRERVLAQYSWRRLSTAAERAYEAAMSAAGRTLTASPSASA